MNAEFFWNPKPTFTGLSPFAKKWKLQSLVFRCCGSQSWSMVAYFVVVRRWYRSSQSFINTPLPSFSNFCMLLNILWTCGSFDVCKMWILPVEHEILMGHHQWICWFPAGGLRWTNWMKRWCTKGRNPRAPQQGHKPSRPARPARPSTARHCRLRKAEQDQRSMLCLYLPVHKMLSSLQTAQTQKNCEEHDLFFQKRSWAFAQGHCNACQHINSI